MSVRQRSIVPAEAESTAQLWSGGYPAGGTQTEPSIPEPLPSDQYVTVDERVEGVVGVVAADWPTIDAGGLRFGGTISTAWFDETELQAAVNQLRRDVDQLDRPLRIGDSFWVRGYSPASPDAWEDLRDITIYARAMAKGAAAVVAVGAIDRESFVVEAEPDIVDEGFTGDRVQGSPPDQPPPSGSATASPVV